MSQQHQDPQFALTQANYRFIIAGLACIVIGYIVMSGGASPDPNVFNYNEVFSPIRITAAPLLCLVGYILVLVGIIKKPA